MFVNASKLPPIEAFWEKNHFLQFSKFLFLHNIIFWKRAAQITPILKK